MLYLLLLGIGCITFRGFANRLVQYNGCLGCAEDCSRGLGHNSEQGWGVECVQRPLSHCRIPGSGLTMPADRQLSLCH